LKGFLRNKGSRSGEGERDSARGAAAILVARAGEEKGAWQAQGALEKVVWGNTRGMQAVWVGEGLGAARWLARWRRLRRTALP